MVKYDGEKSIWKKGEKINNDSIIEVSKTSKPTINLKDDLAEIYYPVKYDGKARYVIYILIDTKSYFTDSIIAEGTLSSVIENFNNYTNKTIIISLIISLFNNVKSYINCRLKRYGISIL
ncbi:hypothetical protein [Wukongibacter sp. M2B1]|uniref:hypothetical protein n=1 Tax=Wukongibacter sp. M2B1 TaxID=3088895 RepID=UPI003D795120